MRLLLDTHTFLWWDGEPSKLSARALAACQEPANTLVLSTASAWEMQIKQQLGKLKLSLSLREIITAQQQSNGLEVLPIQLEHVLRLEALPAHHKDPFDRLLNAQAVAEDMPLVSADPNLAQYPVQLLW